MTNHADFDAAPEERRWTKPLEELRTVLQHEAYGLRGEWAWRVLPHGALVSLRVPADFQKQLRIARRAGLKDEVGLTKWLAEVRTFQKHLDVERWSITEIVGKPGEAGPIHVILREPAPLGANSDETKCARCGKPTHHEPQFKEDLCTECATILGAEEAQARRET